MVPLTTDLSHLRLYPSFKIRKTMTPENLDFSVEESRHVLTVNHALQQGRGFNK